MRSNCLSLSRMVFCVSAALYAALLASAAAMAADSSTAARNTSRPPNIVLIVADDLGYSDLGCFGNRRVVSPNLDRLASDGVRLTSLYVSWPACTPSRGSILTGRYPQRNGLYDMIRNDMINYGHRFSEEEYAVSPEMTLGMDLREVMISRPLHEAGYTSGVFGKWDGGRARRYLPLSRGFDAFYGFANTGIDYWTHERYGVPSMFRGNERTTEDKGQYSTDLFKREALAFVRHNADRPFFLYLPFNAPHGASNLEKGGAQAPDETIAKHYGDLDPKDKFTVYMACVTHMDEAIGELLNTLDELNLSDDTFVFFVSDNGGGSERQNVPLRAGKSKMFEGGVRVAALARFPGRIPAGTVCDEFLSTYELFPTILAVSGAPRPPGVLLDGFDMMPVLEGKAASQRTTMFWQRRGDRAARVGNYKWVDSAIGSGLFDLSADISEEHDLSEEKPEVLKMVKDKFAAWRNEMDLSEPRGPFRDY